MPAGAPARRSGRALSFCSAHGHEEPEHPARFLRFGFTCSFSEKQAERDPGPPLGAQLCGWALKHRRILSHFAAGETAGRCPQTCDAGEVFRGGMKERFLRS